MADLLFYLMAVGAVLFAFGVVALRTPIASVISLLGSFFCLATIYLIAGFPFLAAVQILVYAGAVLVLFLFVIMLLNLADARELPRFDRDLFARRRLAANLAVAAGVLGMGLFAIGASEVQAADPEIGGAAIDTLDGMAAAMFTRYLLPFEATSILLLATAVAVLVLAKRQRGPARGAPGTATATALPGGNAPHAASAPDTSRSSRERPVERPVERTGAPR